MSRVSKSDRTEAVARLREWLKPGDTVYTILRHVSRSGMQREVGVVLLKDSRDPDKRDPVDLHPNWAVATALGERLGKRDGVVVGGCGMDMGFHLVYSVARTIFPEGFGCIGQGCPSNDHSNGDRDYTPHTAGDPLSTDSGMALGNRQTFVTTPVAGQPDKCVHWHRDGGYALRQRWL